MWNDIPEGKFKFVCLLTFFGLCNFFLFSWNLRLLPLMVMSLIGNLAPFWASILGHFINKENMLGVEIVAMAFCFLCIVGITLGKDSDSGPEAITGNVYNHMGIGIVLAFCVSWFRASQCVTNRIIKDVHFSLIMFWYNAWGAIFPFIGLMISKFFAAGPFTFYNYSSTAFMWLILGSLCDFTTCMAVFIAFQNDSSGFVSLLAYASVFWAFISDALIFQQKYTFLQISCALLILGTCWGIALYKYLRVQK